jgi:hypothetical protein
MMSTTELAQVLFTTTLQPSDELSPFQVRRAVDERLCACGGDPSLCAAYVAQEAGDHPETYVRRMRWALTAVARAYSPELARSDGRVPPPADQLVSALPPNVSRGPSSILASFS